MLNSRIVEPGLPWQVTETCRLYDLIIREGGQLLAPEGSFLTLTVNGCGRPIAPGTYRGDVVVSVTEPYHMAPHGLMCINQIETDFKQAAVICDNKVVQRKCVPAILQAGTVGDTETDGLYLASTEDDFNGLIIEGASRYTVRNSCFDLEGNGHNDWLGVGAAVTAIDDAEVLIENCRFHFSSVTRCLLQVGGRSNVVVRDCRLINLAPDGEEWVGSFSWAVGFRGHNRVAQLCDSAKVRYENCTIHGNGWGLLSIDGSDDPVEMYVKDCQLSLSGPRNHGYGAFCIGDNHITYDHSRVDVFGYPILLMGMEGKGVFDVLNGTEIKGRRFGAMVVSDDNSHLNIWDSSFHTGSSCLCVKGSSTLIDIRRSQLTAGNGTILQLMDTDEAGMDADNFKIPVGVLDVRDSQRDLSTVSETEDVILRLTDCRLSGNFYNSTTNIRAYRWSTKGGRGKLHDLVIGPMPEFGPEPPGGAPRHNGDDLKGAKNLGVELIGTSVTGVISAASQAYREGLTLITWENRDELSNVTQQAAEPVNNGVVVTLDSTSVWNVTGTSYLTGLTLAEGAVLAGAEGKAVTLSVNGVVTPIAPGTYTGLIQLTVK